MSRRGDPCRDCRVDTSFDGVGHYYTVHEDLWRQATRGDLRIRFLCLDCLEARLGRSVTEADFVATPAEILARFADEAGEPLPPAERQQELQHWREWWSVEAAAAKGERGR